MQWGSRICSQKLSSASNCLPFVKSAEVQEVRNLYATCKTVKTNQRNNLICIWTVLLTIFGLLLHEKCFFNNDPPLLCSRHISVHGYAIDLSMLQSVNRCEEAKNCKAGKGHLVQRVWPFRFISNRPPCFVLASANLLSPHKKSLAVS